jgi:hypothetical protein
LVISCKKLEPTGPARLGTGPLTFEPAKFNNAIPDDQGALIGVTQITPDWAALWFQKPDRAISVVYVNITEGRISDRSLAIPRK